MKIKLFLLLILVGVLPSAFAYRHNYARVDICAADHQAIITPLEITGNILPEVFEWEKDGGKWGLCVNLPGSAAWQNGVIKFKTDHDGELTLSLRGPYVIRNGIKQRCDFDYSFMAFNGKTLFDSQSGTCLKVWHDEPKDFKVTAVKGKTNEIKVRFRMSGKAEVSEIKPADGWKAVDMSDLNVRPGSILDLSPLLTSAPVTEDTRLIAAGNYFVRKNAPSIPVRLTGCSISPILEFPELKNKDDIVKYAGLIKRQGYNLVRPHFLDYYLMEGAAADLEFNPAHLDNFEYLVYCLKQEGVYIFFDAMTAWSGYFKGSLWPWNPERQGDLKSGLLYDQAAREHWFAGVKKLMTHVNPYTGTVLINDPAVMCVLFFNEQGVTHFDKWPVLDKLWHEWLKRKYGSTENLIAAYKNNRSGIEVPANPDIGSMSMFLNQRNCASRDAWVFIGELQSELNRWYFAKIREIGYSGPVTQWDSDNDFHYLALRNDMPVIAMHNYHDHPSDFVRQFSEIRQTSSVVECADYFTRMMLSRFFGRPFIITEYTHCFWNQYRFEQGLVCGALASFQDIAGVMPHAIPARFKSNKPMTPFHIYNDPIDRASEVVTNFIYLRGDVAPSVSRVTYELNQHEIVSNGYGKTEFPDWMCASALLSEVGVSYSDLPAPGGKTAKSGYVMPVSPLSWASRDAKSEFYLKLLEFPALKNNESVPGRGLFIAGNQQFELNKQNGTFKVSTAKLEGVSFTVPADIKLNRMTVLSPSVPAGITVIAVDGQPLENSRRILLVCATDALNDGMKFTDHQKNVILSNGNGNILLRTFKAGFELVNNNSGDVEIKSIAFNGLPKDRIPSTMESGRIKFALDTESLPGGPAVFFEITVK